MRNKQGNPRVLFNEESEKNVMGSQWNGTLLLPLGADVKFVNGYAAEVAILGKDYEKSRMSYTMESRQGESPKLRIRGGPKSGLLQRGKSARGTLAANLQRQTLTTRQTMIAQAAQRSTLSGASMDRRATSASKVLDLQAKTEAKSPEEELPPSYKHEYVVNQLKNHPVKKLIRFPLWLVATLHETHLFWWFIQIAILLWLWSLYDYRVRRKSPIAEIPRYTANLTPWLPNQLSIRTRLYLFWATVCFVYQPAIVLHLSYFLDHFPEP